jgi:hypothetical protein
MKKVKKVARQKVAHKKGLGDVAKGKGKGLTRKKSFVRAVRFAEKEEGFIKQAVAIWQRNFPEENHSFNSFVRMSSVGNANRTINASTGESKWHARIKKK